MDRYLTRCSLGLVAGILVGSNSAFPIDPVVSGPLSDTISPAFSETTLQAASDSISEELASLRKRVQALESAEAKRAKTSTQSPGNETSKGENKTANRDQRSDADSSKQEWTVKLGGHVQLDYINWAHAAPAIVGDQDYFEFRRLRLIADGKGYRNCDFRLQLTLEPETVGESAGAATSPDVKDAYFSMNEIPWLGRLRIGNFFVPFSLEQVTNDSNNIFLERSIPSQGIFAADREVGIALYNATANQRLTWCCGAFFDSISETLKERIDDNQGIRLSGRLTCLPYFDAASNGRYLIHTGIGVLHTDDQDDRVRFRARPQVREGPRLIDSGILEADSYTSGNLEAAIVWGRVTVQSEGFLSSVNRNAAEGVQVQGAYVHLSYFLTGENRRYERFGQHGAQFGRNVPYSNFSLTSAGHSYGAWELKTRWSLLDLDRVGGGKYNDLTAGFNWYWSDRTRFMFDWIHPFTTEDTTFGAVEADLLAMRFDFNW